MITLEKCLPGWNQRCNHCGSYGMSLYPGERPVWGSLALCESCAKEYFELKREYEKN